MLQVLGGALVAAFFWSVVTCIAFMASKGE